MTKSIPFLSIYVQKGEGEYLHTVPMVLNPNGIEPTFLKLDSWSPGAGFISIITSNVLNLIKKKELKKKKKFYEYKKNQ